MRTLGLIQWFKALSGWRMKRVLRFCGSLFFVTLLAAGCAHYPVNQPIKEYRPGTGYRFSQVKPPENSDSLLLLLTFSGGGTRAEQHQQSLVPAVTLSFTWLRSSLMR